MGYSGRKKLSDWLATAGEEQQLTAPAALGHFSPAPEVPQEVLALYR